MCAYIKLFWMRGFFRTLNYAKRPPAPNPPFSRSRDSTVSSRIIIDNIYVINFSNKSSKGAFYIQSTFLAEAARRAGFGHLADSAYYFWVNLDILPTFMLNRRCKVLPMLILERFSLTLLWVSTT